MSLGLRQNIGEVIVDDLRRRPVALGRRLRVDLQCERGVGVPEAKPIGGRPAASTAAYQTRLRKLE